MVNKGIINGNYAFIVRGNEEFKIGARGIFMETRAFVCKKCNHIWLPKDRNLFNLPLHCPKCGDKYWFASHKEIIRLRQKTFPDKGESLREEFVWDKNNRKKEFVW